MRSALVDPPTPLRVFARPSPTDGHGSDGRATPARGRLKGLRPGSRRKHEQETSRRPRCRRTGGDGARVGRPTARSPPRRRTGRTPARWPLQSAHRLIASNAPALKISSHDAFRALPVQSSHGIQYAPYERTYRGLPVVGGDFVVVTDADGQVLSTSVAQTHQVSLRSVTPTVGQGRGRARRPATRCRTPTAATPAHLVVWQHGARSRLGWETTVTGHRGAMPDDQGRRRRRPQRPGAPGPRAGRWRAPATPSGRAPSRSRPRCRARRTR